MDCLLDLLLILLSSFLYSVKPDVRCKKIRQILLALNVQYSDHFDGVPALQEHIEHVCLPLPVLKIFLQHYRFESAMPSTSTNVCLSAAHTWFTITSLVNGISVRCRSYCDPMVRTYEVMYSSALAIYEVPKNKWTRPTVSGDTYTLSDTLVVNNNTTSDTPIIAYIPNPVTFSQLQAENMFPENFLISGPENMLFSTHDISTNTEDIQIEESSTHTASVSVETQDQASNTILTMHDNTKKRSKPKIRTMCQPIKALENAASELRDIVSKIYEPSPPSPELMELPFYPQRKARALRRSSSNKRLKKLSRIVERLEAVHVELSC